MFNGLQRLIYIVDPNGAFPNRGGDTMQGSAVANGVNTPGVTRGFQPVPVV